MTNQAGAWPEYLLLSLLCLLLSLTLSSENLAFLTHDLHEVLGFVVVEELLQFFVVFAVDGVPSEAGKFAEIVAGGFAVSDPAAPSGGLFLLDPGFCLVLFLLLGVLFHHDLNG